MLEALERRLAQGQWLQAKKEAEALLLLPREALSQSEWGRAYLGYGRACTWLQEYYAAARALESAIQWAFQAKDWDTLGFSRANYGMVLLAIGDVQQAIEVFATYYLDLSRYRDAKGVEANVRYNHGLALRRQKRYCESIGSYRMALDLFILKGQTRDAADCHQNIAWAYLLHGKPEDALPHLKCARSFAKALGPDYQAEMHVCWAFYHFTRAEPGTAMEYAVEILAGAQAGVEHRHRSQATWIAGEVALTFGSPARALDLGRLARAHAIESRESELMNRASDLLRKAEQADGGKGVAAQ